MKDKINKNELMDIKTINIPDLDQVRSDSNVYVYAEYLKPGYH